METLNSRAHLYRPCHRETSRLDYLTQKVEFPLWATLRIAALKNVEIHLVQGPNCKPLVHAVRVASSDERRNLWRGNKDLQHRGLRLGPGHLARPAQ